MKKYKLQAKLLGVNMKIKMYGLSTCPHCKNTLKLLKAAEADYEVIWLDELQGEEKKEAMKKMHSITGGYSVPLCIKGDEWVFGYDKEKLEELIK